MLIDQLLQLVRQYVVGEIGHAPFRDRFVSRFLSIVHADPLIEKIVNAVESVCADFSEGLCDEPALRASLGRIVPPAQVTHTASLGQAYVYVYIGPPAASIVSVGATIDANSIALMGARNSPVTRARLEEPVA